MNRRQNFKVVVEKRHEPTQTKSRPEREWPVYSGILLRDWIPGKTTINSDYYTTTELEELQAAIKRERRGHPDSSNNARPHVSALTTNTIRRLGFECLPHPAYSPDLAPSDYWLFGEMKRAFVE